MELNGGCSSDGHKACRRHPTTKEEQEEIALQKGSHKLKVEAQQRKEQLEADILVMRSKFEIQEGMIRKDRDCALLHKIRSQSIEGARKTTVPAYTFRRFLELPLEIQVLIWTEATRVAKPATHPFVEMASDGAISSLSSRVWTRDSVYNRSFPILETCQTSRMIALKHLSRIRSRRIYGGGASIWQSAWFNFSQETFYFMNEHWFEYKILVDLTNQLNSTRPLRESIRLDLEPLLKIRFLALDLFIFATAPSILWTQFLLEGLSIIIYPVRYVPSPDCRGIETTPNEVEGDFLEVAKYPIFRKRADWLLKLVTKSLEKAQETKSSWRIPKLEVLIRHGRSTTWPKPMEEIFHLEENSEHSTKVVDESTTDQASDSENDEAFWQRENPALHWQLQNATDSYEDDTDSQEEDPEREYDARWYKEAEELMESNHVLPTSTIARKLKFYYHPPEEHEAHSDGEL